MKRIILSIVLFFWFISGFSYSWDQLGNMNVNATKLCFGTTYLHIVICTDDGMVFYNIGTHESEYFSYSGLPVKGVAYLGPTKVLVAMGNGSYSDGIWSFDWQTHQFEVIEWLVSPSFLYFDDFSNKYWAGSEWGGLYESTDGYNWQENEYFLAKPCLNMEGYGEHLIVTAIADISNSFWSNDSGATWQYSTVFSSIEDMRFSNYGVLYGVFPGYSNSSGLWKSLDFGDTWQVEFYSDNMSAVGFDCFGDCFVGWEEAVGLAKYDPNAPSPGFTYLNDGLPNLNINRIQLNPAMSAPALFVCTDSGVFWSLDYFLTGNEEIPQTDASIRIFPNPAIKNVNISSEKIIRQIVIYSMNGMKMLAIETKSSKIDLDVSGLKVGIYFIEIIDFESVIQKQKLLVY